MTPRLDRRAATALAIFALVAGLVNADRFVLGKAAPLRAHDLADNTATITAACGEFWRSGLSSVWDASQLRGWPRIGSAQHPQTLWCLTGAAVAPERILPVLHTVLLAVMAVGSFLFVRCFLRRPHETAVAGAVLSVALFYFFHEHPVVTSATLLPALLGFLSVPRDGRPSRVLSVAGLVLIIGLSNPPATLVAMPLGHLALTLAAPRTERRSHLLRWAGFWGVYALYYGPTMLSQMGQFEESNRSLFRPAAPEIPFLASLKERVLNGAVLSPAFVFLALVSRRTWRGTLLFLLGGVVWVALATFNDVYIVNGLGRLNAIVLALSTTYYRTYYFLPVAVLVWAVWLFDDVWQESVWLRVSRACGMAVFCWIVAAPAANLGRLFSPFWLYAAVLAVTMGLGVSWWARRGLTTLAVVALVFLFARYQYTRIYEVPQQGNLFVEQPFFAQSPGLVRAVTVMADCDAVDVFPAQAAAAGVQTLDGIANFYSRRFAERWRYFVADNPATCTSRYAGWSTRAEITVADLKYASDRILAWAWINNVTFVRSIAPLDYPALQLVDQRTYRVDDLRDVTRYLYRVASPVSRVFTIPADVARRAGAGDLRAEEQAVFDLQESGGVSNVDVEAVNGSRLRFRGAFPRDRVVIANMNYHPGWRLRVDGALHAAPLTPGPFGMISLPAVEGIHDFELEFASRETPFVPAFMVGAMTLLWIGPSSRACRWLRQRAIAAAPARKWRPHWSPWRVAGSAVVVAGVGIFGAVLAGSRAAADVPAWLDSAWSGRIRLQADGARQSAPVTGFPLRIEFNAPDSPLWEHVQESGSDLRFTDAGGQRILPQEIEELDVRRRRLIAWVKVPELHPESGTTAYLYFGNPAASSPRPAQSVWDSEYEGVWHMNPRRAANEGALHDSTDRARTGVLHNIKLPADDRSLGIPFDGVESWVAVPNWPGLDSSSGDWTVEFRVRPAPKAKRNFELLEHGSEGTFNLYLHNGGYLVLERKNGDRVSEVGFSSEYLQDDTWTAVAVSRTRGQLRIALDGVALAGYPVRPPFRDGSFDAQLKMGTGRHGWLEGRLAEVRISRGVARSPDWILASFRSHAVSFVSFGVPERRQ